MSGPVEPIPALVLRPETPEDIEFLRRLYAETREAELSRSGWDEAQRAAFLTIQFDAQRRHYREHFPGASFDVVLVDGRRSGRLYVARWPQEIRIIDIALIAACRERGLGTRLLEGLLAEATTAASTVSLHVESNNRALGWYRRHGFNPVEERGAHLFMRWGSGGRLYLPDRRGS